MSSSSDRAVDFHMQINERSFWSNCVCWLGPVEPDAPPPVGRTAAIMVKASKQEEKNDTMRRVELVVLFFFNESNESLCTLSTDGRDFEPISNFHFRP